MNAEHFEIKRRYFQEWVADLPGVSKVTLPFDREFVLTPDATRLLNRIERIDEEALYMLLFSSDGARIPGYIGKSRSPYRRWNDGHLGALREGLPSYKRWRDLIGKFGTETFTLVCVNQAEILRPPIPGFPTNVGSVEYQLVSLASAVYQDTLLNREGVAR